MPVPFAAAEAALRRFFGYDCFRPGQIDVVQSVISGRDTLGVLPTGGGKSLCYQVPALVLPGLTVVVSPLISLMKDQVDRLVGRGVAAAFLNSSVPASDAARSLDSARRGILKLLYVAPERLEAAGLRRILGQCAVSLLAVDEAHCISEWGHEFRPSFRRIADASASVGMPPVVALTATATPRVRADIARLLRLREPRVIVGGFDRPNLRYDVHRCRSDAEKDAAMIGELRRLRAPAVVYVATRATVERVARALRKAGVAAAPYHGGLCESARAQSQETFMRERSSTIVATNAFGMGIDKPDVRLVLHHAMPGTLEAYYQEAGRAGRDGDPARCLMLYATEDRFTHEWFIDGSFPDAEIVRRVHRTLCTIAVNGRIPTDAPAIARCCTPLTTRQVSAALGLLIRCGIVVRDPAPARVRARLLATPERIASELPADGIERSLLRLLWRDGAVAERRFHLEDLPPGMRGRIARAALETLRDRQFVDFGLLEPEHRLSGMAVDEAVDWTRLRCRRRAELAKLDAMEQYATTTRCRREVLLSYFGERASPQPCTGCDNCVRSGRHTQGAPDRRFP